MIEAYWDPRHHMCTIDSDCRMQDAARALIEQVVPGEPEPGADATLVAYTAWAERMRIRQRLLDHVQ